MFARPKTWISGGLWKPKNPHSLEHLKYLYTVLCKNQTITDTNRSLLVETLRSISEILIWGDQNDGSVFDFFLEKNMLSFFLRYLRQKSGRYICVQLLQTLNILFENISDETSVYYLLSNNHINSIIEHKFDFSDEEVMAYYISFLKTLSLKLNKHTIHFFYNEHTNDFALYTEAIKFFNHPESMVRIAVRTITLNVYKVDDDSMLRYIRNRTAAPYFSNLVWFIGNHIIELDTCVRNDADHQSRDRLADLVAEHLDHIHYLNDILCLKIECLNDVLTDHLLETLLLPLYVYPLLGRNIDTIVDPPRVSSIVSLFLLSQLFLTVTHTPLVRQLADIILNGDQRIFAEGGRDVSSSRKGHSRSVFGFVAPEKPLAQSLDNCRGLDNSNGYDKLDVSSKERQLGDSTFYTKSDYSTKDVLPTRTNSTDYDPPTPSTELPGILNTGTNSTDEEKLLGASLNLNLNQAEFNLDNRPFLRSIFNSLECGENDYQTLFALGLIYALGHNNGLDGALLAKAFLHFGNQPKDDYNTLLMELLLTILSIGCQKGSRVRLATMELCCLLIKQLVTDSEKSYLQDRHYARIIDAKEESVLLLKNFYKSEEIFVDMFEDEFADMHSKPLNVEYLMMDASILLPPTGTPLTGIEFIKRLPCGEVERVRKAIRTFFILRKLKLDLEHRVDLELPLTKPEECVNIGNVLDLNNSDLIACTVITRDKRERRFLVIDAQQLILVEPDIKRLGWGVVRFVGFLQNSEVCGDKEDSRVLHVTIHRPTTSNRSRAHPALSARFAFDDHIRCMAAKQRLTKGRHKARQKKMHSISRLLEFPGMTSEPFSAQPSSVATAAQYQASLNATGRPDVTMPIQMQHHHAALQDGASVARSSSGHAYPQPTNAKPDVAEPAFDSASASAFHHLNASSSRNAVPSIEGRTTPRKTSVPKNIEIPMEDLSTICERHRRKSGPTYDFPARRRTTIPSGRAGEVKKRSSSYSPSRKTQPKSTSFTTSPSPQVMKAAVQRLEKKTKTLLRPRSMSGPVDAAHRVRDVVEEASATTTAELHKIGQQLLLMSKPSSTPRNLVDLERNSRDNAEEAVVPSQPVNMYPYSMRQHSAPDIGVTRGELEDGLLSRDALDNALTVVPANTDVSKRLDETDA